VVRKWVSLKTYEEYQLANDTNRPNRKI
jgi:hypothetical protein